MTHIEKTDGKSFGPITGGVISVGTIVTLVTAIGAAFGVVIPAEVATAAVTLLAGVVSWYTKGQVEIREEPTTAVAAPLQSDPETEPETGGGSTAAEAEATVADPEDDSTEADAVPTMEDAVARAKEVMSEDGGKARLKTALSSVGATRVSAIPEDKITEFMEALDD